MSYKTKDFKITFLGVTPVLQDETGYLKPQDIVALSALMTFKGKTVKNLYKDAIEKGQDMAKKIKTIHRKSSLRGHASMATTPAVCFNYEASKFIDSLMTGMVFSSSFMASGRRTDTTVDDIVYPTDIDKNPAAKKLYKETSEKIINFFNLLLEKGIPKDDASKLLQYGIYGTGTISYPIESLVAFKKEIEMQGEWVPEEAHLFLHEIERYLKKVGVELIYAARDLAARNFYPYPNIFKNPANSNLTRELVKKEKIAEDFSKIVDFHALLTPGLLRRAKEIYKLNKEFFKDKKLIKKRWRELLSLRQKFLNDYNTAISIKILSKPSWRVWSEKKRHRTTHVVPESLYYCINRARPVFQKLAAKIDLQKLTQNDIKAIDRIFTLPSPIKANPELLHGFLETAKNAMETYYQLIEKYKIKPAEAVYVMPRAVRIDVLQEYDLYNLISGYYPLRTCSTADTQVQAMTLIEMAKIKKMLIGKGLGAIADLMVTKCWIPGFCLEEKNCPIIKGCVKDYDEKFHEEMKTQLDEEFEERLKNLGK